MRTRILLAVASLLPFGLVGGMSAPASAGLITTPANTVDAVYCDGSMSAADTYPSGPIPIGSSGANFGSTPARR